MNKNEFDCKELLIAFLLYIKEDLIYHFFPVKINQKQQNLLKQKLTVYRLCKTGYYIVLVTVNIISFFMFILQNKNQYLLRSGLLLLSKLIFATINIINKENKYIYNIVTVIE